MRIVTGYLMPFIVLGFFSCGESTQPSQEAGEEASASSPADTLCGPGLICPDGLSFIQLGDYIQDIDTFQVDTRNILDELITEGGYHWVTRTVSFPEGEVIIEGDFIPVEQANDTLLSMSRVNRLRIESADFSTPEGIHVGSPFASLLEIFDQAQLEIIPLPQYSVIQIAIPEKNNIAYLISHPGIPGVNDAPSWTPDMIPPESPIRAIVVM